MNEELLGPSRECKRRRWCVSCRTHMEVGDIVQVVPAGKPGSNQTITIHQGCIPAYLKRRQGKLDKLPTGGKAGAYHQRDGRVYRGTNSC